MDVEFRRLLRTRIEQAFLRIARRPRTLDPLIDEAVLGALRGLVRREVDVALEQLKLNGPGFRGTSRR